MSTDSADIDRANDLLIKFELAYGRVMDSKVSVRQLSKLHYLLRSLENKKDDIVHEDVDLNTRARYSLRVRMFTTAIESAREKLRKSSWSIAYKRTFDPITHLPIPKVSWNRPIGQVSELEDRTKFIIRQIEFSLENVLRTNVREERKLRAIDALIGHLSQHSELVEVNTRIGCDDLMDLLIREKNYYKRKILFRRKEEDAIRHRLTPVYVVTEDAPYECCVCLDMLDEMLKTKCGHLICKDCFKRLNRKSCPSCRADITIAEDEL